jgi:hypothetical protein
MTRPLAAVRTDLARIRPLRERFLAGAAFQVRHHAHHEHGWTDSYGLTTGDAVQEIQKQCCLHGRIPAARCHIRNVASGATLAKAGMRRCGFLLMADVVTIAG